MKKIKLSFLFENGDVEEFVQEGTDEELESVIEAIYASFRDNDSAVIRLKEGNISTFIRLTHVSRVNFELIKEGLHG